CSAKRRTPFFETWTFRPPCLMTWNRSSRGCSVLAYQPGLGSPPMLPAPPPDRIIVGLDLGEVKDFTAINGLQQSCRQVEGKLRKNYECKLLVRWPLHTSYETIIENVRSIALRLPYPPELVLDATGAGRPVAQMFRKAKLPVKRFIPVIITGGTQVVKGAD